MADAVTFEFTFQSCIRGYHIYKDIWEPKIDEEVNGHIEDNNDYDKFAVAFLKNKKIVGHVPLEYSKVCNFFLKRGGHITAKITGKRENNNCGLELPALYIFKGSKKDTDILQKLLKKL